MNEPKQPFERHAENATLINTSFHIMLRSSQRIVYLKQTNRAKETYSKSI